MILKEFIALAAAGTTALGGFVSTGAATKPWQRIACIIGCVLLAVVSVALVYEHANTPTANQALVITEFQLLNHGSQKDAAVPAPAGSASSDPADRRTYVDLVRIESGDGSGYFEQGQPLSVRAYLKNGGRFPAQDLRGVFALYVQPRAPSSEETVQAEKDLFRAFLRDTRPGDAPSRGTLADGAEAVGTARGQQLPPEQVGRLQHGDDVLYILGAIMFRDDVGEHAKEFCRWLQPPNTWRVCEGHHE